MKFADEISGRFGMEVTPVDSPEEAVTGCDLIVTAGPILKEPHATIQPGWMDPGAFASLIDFDSYWSPAALNECDLFVTDDIPQLLHYKDAGYFQDIPDIHADLGEMVIGIKMGRTSAHQRTIACNLGLAMDDMAVAPTVYQRAVAAGLGTWLSY